MPLAMFCMYFGRRKGQKEEIGRGGISYTKTFSSFFLKKKVEKCQKRRVISVRCLGSVVGPPCSTADGPPFLPHSLSPDNFLALFFERDKKTSDNSIFRHHLPHYIGQCFGSFLESTK